MLGVGVIEGVVDLEGGIGVRVGDDVILGVKDRVDVGVGVGDGEGLGVTGGVGLAEGVGV